MQINFTIFATGAVIAANKLRYKAFEASAATVPVTILTEDPPHTFPHAVTLNVQNPVPHLVAIYSTPDSSDGTLLSNFLYDPTWTNVDIRTPWEIRVGGGGALDPAPGATEIPLPDVDGWEYWPERRATYGTMSSSEYALLPSGGIKLTQAIDQFENGEIIFIHFKPKVTISQPTFNYLNLYTGNQLIDSSIDIDVTYARKLCQVAAVSTGIALTMKPLSEIPDNSRFVFTTFYGNQKQVAIKGTGGNVFKITNTGAASIFLGTNDYTAFVKYSDGFYMENIGPSMSEVGQFFDADIKDIPNAAYCDGELLGSFDDFPRVEAYLNTPAPGVVFASVAARTAAGFKGSAQWVKDNTTRQIYKPDCRGLSSKALKDGRNDFGLQWTRPDGDVPGSVEDGANLKHNHLSDARFNKLGAKASDIDGGGTPKDVDSSNPTSEYRIAYMSGPGYDLWSNATMRDDGKVENVVRNDGRYRMVKI